MQNSKQQETIFYCWMMDIRGRRFHAHTPLMTRSSSHRICRFSFSKCTRFVHFMLISGAIVTLKTNTLGTHILFLVCASVCLVFYFSSFRLKFVLLVRLFCVPLMPLLCSMAVVSPIGSGVCMWTCVCMFCHFYTE